MGSGNSRHYDEETLHEMLETNTDKKVKLNFEFERGKIKVIPQTVFTSKYVREQVQVLNLIGNQISEVPADIRYLQNLSYISITSNRITSLPDELAECAQLEVIMAYDNRLTSLPPCLARLQLLKKVDVHRNRFQHFPPVLTQTASLKWLSIGDNPINEIPDAINNLHKLENLYLNNMNLTALPDTICDLCGLETLNIKGNQVRELPRNFANLGQLRQHYYGEGLNLEGNPLELPPLEICEQGPAAIFAYLQELTHGRPVTNRRPNLILIGESGAGKTSLSNAMIEGRSRLTEEDDRTFVVNRRIWRVEDEEELQFQVTDLGAQENYRMHTYHFFITRDAIFIQVFDLKNTYPSFCFDQWMGSWLDMLNARAPGASVVIVATHSDLMKSDDDVFYKKTEIERAIRDMDNRQTSDLKAQIEVLEQALEGPHNIQATSPLYGLSHASLETRKSHVQSQLHNRVKLLLPIYVVSSAPDLHGIAALRSDIIQIAKDTFHAKVIPRSWFELQGAIDEERRGADRYLTYDFVEEHIGQGLGMYDRERLDNALQFLHLSGDILWYGDVQQLRSLIFHKPDELVQFLRSIFRHDMDRFLSYRNPLFRTEGGLTEISFARAKDEFLKNGRLCDELLKVFWNEFNLDWRTYNTMKELLVKFDWCYQVPDSQRAPGAHGTRGALMFPSYLSQSRPRDLIDLWPVNCPIGILQLTAEFHFPNQCPPGFFEKAMVRINRFVSGRRDWKDGVYATSNLNRLLLERIKKVDVPAVSLAVRGPQDDIIKVWKDFLPVVRAIRQILLQWPGVRYEIMTLCPHCVSAHHEQARYFCGEILEQVVPEDTTHLTCYDQRGRETQIPANFVYLPQQVFNI